MKPISFEESKVKKRHTFLQIHLSVNYRKYAIAVMQ